MVDDPYPTKGSFYQGCMDDLKHVFAPKAAPIKVEAKVTEDSLHRIVTARIFVLLVKVVELR
jgi:hypothetical protein